MWHRLIHNEPGGTDMRLASTRIALAWTAWRIVRETPDASFYAEHDEALAGVRPTAVLSTNQLRALRRATLLALVAYGAGLVGRATGPAAAALFSFYTWNTTRAFPGLWNYNTHVNFLLSVAAFADTTSELSLDAVLRLRSREPDPDIQALMTVIMQAMAASVYTQAGLSKVVHGRSSWLGDGATVRMALSAFGTPLGNRLARSPGLCRAASIATIIAELAFLPVALAARRTHPWLAAGSVTFHLATLKAMDINFSHLWVPVVALFGPPPQALCRNQSHRGDPR